MPFKAAPIIMDISHSFNAFLLILIRSIAEPPSQYSMTSHILVSLIYEP